MSDDSVNRGPCFGQRHVLVICANIGFAIVYCMRANLSVALVAMVNSTDEAPVKNASSGQDGDSCPVPAAAVNASHRGASSGEFQWSKEMQGLVLSSFFWGYVVLQVPGGTLAQRYGAKWLFGGGVLWTATLTLLTPVVARTSVYLLIAVRILEGVGESVTFPAMLAMLGCWSPPQESSLLMSISMFGAGVGTILGQLTSGPLCASSFLGGWPSVFYIHGVLGWLWFVPWWLLVFDSPEAHPRITAEEKEYIQTSIGSNQKQANRGSLPWLRILTSLPVWVFTFLFTVAAWVAYTFLTCLPQFLSDVLHFDISNNGIIASLPYISYCLSTNLFTWACDKMVASQCISRTKARKIFTLICLWGCGGCLFAITFVDCSQVLVIVLLVVGYTMFSANYAGYYSNALDLSPEYAGTVFGIGNIFATGSGIVAPLVTDAITSRGTVSEWQLVLYISSGASAVGGLVYLLGSSERQKWQEEEGHSDDEAEPILRINANETPDDSYDRHSLTA